MTDRLERLEAHITKSVAGLLTELRAANKPTTGKDAMTIPSEPAPEGLKKWSLRMAEKAIEAGYDITAGGPDSFEYRASFSTAHPQPVTWRWVGRDGYAVLAVPIPPANSPAGCVKPTINPENAMTHSEHTQPAPLHRPRLHRQTLIALVGAATALALWFTW